MKGGILRSGNFLPKLDFGETRIIFKNIDILMPNHNEKSSVQNEAVQNQLLIKKMNAALAEIKFINISYQNAVNKIDFPNGVRLKKNISIITKNQKKFLYDDLKKSVIPYPNFDISEKLNNQFLEKLYNYNFIEAISSSEK